MIIVAHSVASYLSEPKACSLFHGHYVGFTAACIPPSNGAILNIVHIIKHLMVSAMEAELGALHI
eukprot:CCRYP_000376-RA/>CCRYP_000376-RA protein AED:0.43 eAED:0.43 QI:0/-1/0/1/-1/0/1/0/64